MRAISSQPAAPRQAQRCDDALAGDLRRELTARGEREAPGTVDRTVAKLRKNARDGINRCADSVVTLLRSNGRVRRVAALLIAGLDPAPAADMRELNRLETPLEGHLNTLQLAYQGGDQSGPVLADIVDTTSALIPVLTQMQEQAAIELLRRNQQEAA